MVFPIELRGKNDFYGEGLNNILTNILQPKIFFIQE